MTIVLLLIVLVWLWKLQMRLDALDARLRGSAPVVLPDAPPSSHVLEQFLEPGQTPHPATPPAPPTKPLAATPAPSLLPPEMGHVSHATVEHVTSGNEAPMVTSAPMGEEVGGRILGKVGMVAILFGVAFFLKYAFENDLIGETGRVFLGIIAGVSALGVGRYLRKKSGMLEYSDLLYGGGVAILYLSIYAGYAFYDIFPAVVAYAAMLAVTISSLALAVAESTRSLSFVAALGGFLTPILLSTGENALGGLSIYLAVVDVGVLGAAFFRKWTGLAFLAFGGTALLLWGWFDGFYTSADYVLYSGIVLLFATAFILVGAMAGELPTFLRFSPKMQERMHLDEHALTGQVLAVLAGLWLVFTVLAGQGGGLGEVTVVLALVNLVILGAAYLRRWTVLHYVAFFGTSLGWTAWFSSHYQAEQLFPVFASATLFFGVTLVAGVAHHLFRQERSTGVDLVVSGGNALWYFAIISALFDQTYHSLMGFFALFLAVIYALVAYSIHLVYREGVLLTMFHAGLALTFLTIAIPLQFSGYWVVIAWFVEALVLFRMRFLQIPEARKVGIGAGVVYILAIFKLLALHDGRVAAELSAPFLNGAFLNGAIAVVVSFAIAYLYHRYAETEASRVYAGVFTVMAGVLALWSSWAEILHFGLDQDWGLVLLALVSGALFGVAVWWGDRRVELAGVGFLGLAVFSLVVSGLVGHTPDAEGTAFLNIRFLAALVIFGLLMGLVYMYQQLGGGGPREAERKRFVAILGVVANVVLLVSLTSETTFYFANQQEAVRARSTAQSITDCSGGQLGNGFYDCITIPQSGVLDVAQVQSLESRKNTAVSILWALYAALLLVIGFAKKQRGIRILGLGLFFLTAIKVFLTVWALGELYRIVSSIVFGVVALGGSYLYARYKDRLKLML